MTERKIVYVTGTRADFGKLKPLILATNADPRFRTIVFATGMHTLDLYGFTVDEIRKLPLDRVHMFTNQVLEEPMDQILGNTITGFSRFVRELKPDLIVVHGDRLETLAGAAVGTLANILVAHIEGGELSGTVDESLRHSISKLAHLHLVADQAAANTLHQLGEEPERIRVIGSPEVDVMLSNDLPTLAQAKTRYEIGFSDYAISMLHPVTTEFDDAERQAEAYFSALQASNNNYIMIYPNNDLGSAPILRHLEALKGNPRFRIFPSLRFEYFLTLLKNARFIVGNSSCGVREAPIYGTPTIDFGTRQTNRGAGPSILRVPSDQQALAEAIRKVGMLPGGGDVRSLGRGNSCHKFMRVLGDTTTWTLSLQKTFRTVSGPAVADHLLRVASLG